MGYCSVSQRRLTTVLFLRIFLIYDDIAGNNQSSLAVFSTVLCQQLYIHALYIFIYKIYIFIAEKSDPILAFIQFYFVLK